jgi:hypothetical protein
MPKPKSIYVMLAGGLGNQLFQLAGALSRDSDICKLDTTLANPRVNVHGKVDISDFNLGQNVVFFAPRFSKMVVARAANYVLRSGMQPKFLENWGPVSLVTNFVTSILLSMRTKEIVRVIQGLNNGYFDMRRSGRKEYLIGYFQSYKWLDQENVGRKMRKIKLNEGNSQLNQFLKDEKGQKSVLVHVRLGDYRLEKDFGILSKGYYEMALNEIEHKMGVERIWLFSDEPENAVSFIPEAFRERIRIVPNFDGKASVTLEAMRYADSYIIANSSLSWWGASLSYAVNPLIIAPVPWFRTKPEPTDLVPLSWTRVNAWD